MLAVKIVLIVLVFVGLIVMLASIARSFMGQAVRGVLHVPQGKEYLDVCVCSDAHLRPFKYGQTFETLFEPGDAVLTSSYTGKVEHGVATISYRGRPVGLICDSNTHSLALLKLAEKHPKVLVQTVVASLESDGRPLMRVMLPADKWFKRALSSKM